MFYELWDVGAGKGLVRYQSETEMAGLVRSLIDHHGDEYATELFLSVEDTDGNQVQSFDGMTLAAWADEILDRSLARDERTPRVSLTRTGATDRGAA